MNLGERGVKRKRQGKLQFFRKGHLGRGPAWVLGNAGLCWNVYFAWLLDGNKEANGFIWLKKQRLMRERGRNSPLHCLVLPVEYQLFILWVQSERKLMGREEDSGNPEGDGGLERKVSSLAWDCF